MEGIRLQKIEYVKVVEPPTLKQFLINRAVKEKSAQTKGISGVTRVGGQLMPRSAAVMKDLKGITADKVLEEHPEWKEDYPKFVAEWREKNTK